MNKTIKEYRKRRMGRLMRRGFNMDEFYEKDHPREENGRFTSKGESSVTYNNQRTGSVKQKYSSSDADSYSYQTQYYSPQHQSDRMHAIMEETGFSKEKAERVMSALCGKGYFAKGGFSEYSVPGWFRGFDKEIREMSNDDAEIFAGDIDDYIMAAPKFKGKIFRGMAINKSEIEGIKVGDIFHENGSISSWSSDENVAKDFSEYGIKDDDQVSVVIETEDPKYGVPTAHLSYFQDEEEVTVSNMHGQDWEITGIDNSNGRYLIRVKLMED